MLNFLRLDGLDVNNDENVVTDNSVEDHLTPEMYRLQSSSRRFRTINHGTFIIHIFYISKRLYPIHCVTIIAGQSVSVTNLLEFYLPMDNTKNKMEETV